MTNTQLLALILSVYPGITATTRATITDPVIAATVSAGQAQQVSTKIGIGDVLQALGPAPGAAVLGTLATMAASNNASPIYWAMQLLAQSALDISLASTQAQLAGLVAGGVLSAAQQSALTALCTVPAPISVDQVSNVLNAAGY